jgi:hypothetical protein
MNSCAKKIQAAAKLDGEESLRYIQCDIDESKGYPVAMLFWPSTLDRRVAFQRLDESHLQTTTEAGLSYIYTGPPLRIEKDLFEMWKSARPLSDDGFRLGFFFLPDSHGDTP